MKDYLSKKAYIKGNSDLGFILSKEAKEKHKSGEVVLNATLGMFFDENEQPFEKTLIYPVLKKCLNYSSVEYASVDGGVEYENSIKKWTFGEYFEDICSSYYVKGLYTMGGTGALYISYKNYVEQGQSILLPSLGWPNYITIAKSLNLDYEYYNFMNDKGVFDIASLLEKVKSSISSFGRATVVINDPAHNPSGYSLSKAEWIKIVDGLNDASKNGDVILVLDIAYMDFAKQSRVFFDVISKIDIDFLTLVCFSGSKAFNLYGFRMGGLIAINKEKKCIEDFFNASKIAIRTSWSVANHYSLNVMNEIMKDEPLITLLKENLQKNIKILNQRAILAKDLLKFLGEPLPYKDGFFLTYKVDNADEVCKRLTKLNIYSLPIQNQYIRVAICSISISSLKKHIEIIHKMNTI